MHTMIYKRFISIQFLFVAQLFIFFPAQGTKTLKGDAHAAPGSTFSFPIKGHISSPEGNNYYVAAHPSLGSPLDCAVSRIYLDGDQFCPLTPELVTLNNADGVKDPLYNQHIAYLGLLSALEVRSTNKARLEHPIVVLANDLTSVYVIDTFYKKNGGAVESAIGITDANGAVTSGIVGLGNMSNVYAIAATKANAGGNFGAVGSGLAVIQLETKNVADDKSSATKRVFSQVGNFPLDVTSSKVKIQNNLAAMSNNVCMQWDESLGLLYVGLQITAGDAAGDGGLAVAILGEAPGLQFNRPLIAPSTVFTPGAQNEIIGAIDANAQVSINQIKTMLTSTKFNYLIVQGANGSPSATKNIVFALPLVNLPSDTAIHGMIADKTQVPNLIEGGFTLPATTPDQMTTIADPAAQVGAGALPAGAITDMFVRGDSVFVTVFQPEVNQLPGMFYSQALFNVNGTIRGWTSWARVAGTIDQNTGNIDQVYAATFDSMGDFTMITGTGVDALFTVKRTVWGTDDNDGLLGGTVANSGVGLIQMMSALFPENQAGVQGIVDLPPATPGLANVSLLIATGLKTVSLIETGVVSGGVLNFNHGDFFTNNVSFKNGTITQNLPLATPTRVVTISGGVLDAIGPVTCAEIAAATSGGNDNAWVAVGGVGGLAILTQSNGDGWSAAAGLGPNFTGLVNGMKFVKVQRDYSFVRKLLCDGDFLYVLTDKQLDFIDLSNSNFGNGTLVAHTLANLQSIMGLKENDTFIDFIVSGKFALLATSKGLFRVGNDKNIAQALNPDGPNWTKVPLPQSVGPATQLFPITSSGRSQDFALGNGSNVYVLNAYVGSNAAQLARYTVQGVGSHDLVSESTIDQILNSYPALPAKSKPIQAPLVFYPGFRDIFATDGAAFFNGRSKNLNSEPFINMVVGMTRGRAINNHGTYQTPLSISSASHISQMIRSTASGNWLVAGDFGLRVNE